MGSLNLLNGEIKIIKRFWHDFKAWHRKEELIDLYQTENTGMHMS